ncbi:hypothetical protein DEI93_07070 [Curtobacterium sp. MCBD17_035]|uniref:zinc ribbon domain-containing protein n=1 Tax=Curtobacterium sp. MCBD17_035 TaxID=2175673 RepID=UPI000DA99822|nr:hypothetical protein [Curtobacterium sp. MCBD17_035]WIB68783.1 hypothetical protein DEI93_07070 [Curtobacterium sp. MCBD17_035]
MKAAPEAQLLLLDLQRIDNDVTRIGHRITGLRKGEHLAELGRRAAVLRSDLAAATGSVEDAERELARLESDTATAQARIDRDTTLLQAAKNAKDAAGLESELASLTRRINDLETTELEVMERLEVAQARLGDVQAQLAEIDGEHDRLLHEREAQVASLEQDLGHVRANRETVAARVPADLLALYERQRARYGFGASLLQGGVSTASGVSLTASDLQTVRAAPPDEVLLCPDSDAILVRTAESGL